MVSTLAENDDLMVRLAEAKDAEDFQALYADERVMEHLSGAKHYPVSLYQEKINQARQQGSLEYLTIESRPSGEFMGCCWLIPYNGANYEIKIILAWKFWQPPHKAHGTNVFNLLARYAKDTLKGSRLVGVVGKTNTRCKNMLKRVGMKRTGDHKEHDRFGNRKFDKDEYFLDLTHSRILRPRHRRGRTPDFGNP